MPGAFAGRGATCASRTGDGRKTPPFKASGSMASGSMASRLILHCRHSCHACSLSAAGCLHPYGQQCFDALQALPSPSFGRARAKIGRRQGTGPCSFLWRSEARKPSACACRLVQTKPAQGLPGTPWQSCAAQSASALQTASRQLWRGFRSKTRLAFQGGMVYKNRLLLLLFYWTPGRQRLLPRRPGPAGATPPAPNRDRRPGRTKEICT